MRGINPNARHFMAALHLLFVNRKASVIDRRCLRAKAYSPYTLYRNNSRAKDNASLTFVLSETLN